MTDLEVVLIALACPLMLPTIIEAESEEKIWQVMKSRQK